MGRPVPLAAALAAALALAPVPARAAGEGPRWIPSLKKAFEIAKERGAPILIWCVMDEDSSNKADQDVLRNKEVQKAMSGFLVVLGNHQEGHGSQDGTLNGKPAKVCRLAPGITCQDHKTAVDEIYRTYGDVCVDKASNMKMPCHFVVNGDGKVLGMINNGTLAGGFDVVQPPKMVEGLKAMLVKAGGPGLTEEQYAAFQKALAAARNSVEQNRMSEAAKTLKPLIDCGKSIGIVKDARELLKRVDREATASLAKAQAILRTDAVSGLVGLDRVAEDYPGTESAALAKKASPEGKKAIKDMGREKEGREKLAKALEVAEGRKDDARALRMLDEVSKAFAGLPVAEDAAGKAQAIRSDPERMKAIEQAQSEREAKSELVAAKGLLDAGKKDEAVKALKAIVEGHPGTKAAEEAQKILDGLR